MSSTKRKKRTGKKDEASRAPVSDAQPTRRWRGMEEKDSPEAPSAAARVITIATMIIACAIWLAVSDGLFRKTDMASMVLIGAMFFLTLMAMFAVRCLLEAHRRYGRSDIRSCFYYSQQITHDQKWSLWICLSFFAVFTVMRWLVPSPNLDMTALDIATCAYMGYIWTTKYRDERTPFQYMESAFLLLVIFSNYIVYFME